MSVYEDIGIIFIFAGAIKNLKIMKGIGYIYLTTNLVNGKRYVGQHLATEFDTKYKGSGTAMKNAFNKYGWDNFDCKIICWCTTQSQLDACEDNYISLLNTISPNGYNLKRGGSHGKHHKESCKQISESNKGKCRTEETCKKISEAKKGHVVSEETCKKISEGNTNHPKKSKKVLQFTLSGEFVREFPSLAEVQRQLGFDFRHISVCCLGKRKSAYDYIWKFKQV